MINFPTTVILKRLSKGSHGSLFSTISSKVLHFEATGSAHERPTPVVFVCGEGLSHSIWEPVARGIAAHGYNGYVTQLAADEASVDALADSLRAQVERWGLTPPVLVAHSFASFVAQKYLESHPATALVLVNPLPPTLFLASSTCDAVGGGNVVALNWAKVLMEKFEGSVVAHCGTQIAVEGEGEGGARVERRSDAKEGCGDERGRGRRATATRVGAGALMELIMGSYYSVPLVPHHSLALGSRTPLAPGPSSIRPSLTSSPLAAALVSLAAAPHEVGTESSPSFDVNLEPGVVPVFLVCTGGDEALLGAQGQRLSLESLRRLYTPWNEPEGTCRGGDRDEEEILELPLDTSRLPMLSSSKGVLVHRLLAWLDQFG